LTNIFSYDIMIFIKYRVCVPGQKRRLNVWL